MLERDQSGRSAERLDDLLDVVDIVKGGTGGSLDDGCHCSGISSRSSASLGVPRFALAVKVIQPFPIATRRV